MKSFNSIFLIILALAMFSSCDDRPVPTGDDTNPIANNVPTPEKIKSPIEQKIDTLQKQLEELNKKAEEANAKGSKIDALIVEKDALVVKKQLAEAYATEWKNNATAYSSEIKAKDKEISTSRIDSWKVKLWWMAGICGLLGIAAFAITIAYPLLAPFASKAWKILGVASAVMLVVAECLSTVAWLIGFVPYIIGLAAAIGVVYGIAALRHWWLDHRTSNQLIQTLEKLKVNIPNFSDHMDNNLDEPVINHIGKKRVALNLKKKPIVSTTVDISGNK